MMPILRDIEEQALNIQYMTHNIAKWLDNTVRRLEVIKGQCLKEQEDLCELDGDKKSYVQEINSQNLVKNCPIENQLIHDSEIQIKHLLDQDAKLENKDKSDQEELNNLTIRKKKKIQKLQEKITRNLKIQQQQPSVIICQICGAKYTKVFKFKTHMTKFHKIYDFSYENQEKSNIDKNQEQLQTDIPYKQEAQLNKTSNLQFE